jgi:hypothetical protein
MDEECVADVAAEDVQGELAIKRSAIQQVSDEVVAIGLDGGLRFFCKAIGEALVDVPIGRVNGDMADSIAALFQQGAKTVALIGGIAFLKEGVTKEQRLVLIGRDDFLILEEIDSEVRVAGGTTVIQMGIGMIAKHVASLIPG